MDEDEEFANGSNPANPSAQSFDNDDEIQSLLLRHEKKSSSSGGILNQKLHIPGADSDDQSDKSESDSDFEVLTGKNKPQESLPVFGNNENKDDEMSSGDEDGDIPTVKVGGEEYTITDIDDTIIAQMTPEEKDRYCQISQDFYAHLDL
jgi:transcription initiation factor TFIIE subunit alpha